MKTFTIHTNGGLGSRVRALIGAMGYCELTGRKLRVNWPRQQHDAGGAKSSYAKVGGEFKAGLSDLFTNPIECIDIGNPPGHGVLDPAKIDLHFRTNAWAAFPWEKFKRPLVDYLRDLRPTREVRNYMAQIPPWPAPCVGVVVRQTNQQPYHRGIEWYLPRMRQCIDANPNVGFFLWTDTYECSEQLHAEFKSRIIEQHKNYLYDKVGIQKSLAAIYLLARCEWIIGTRSSFVELACWLQGCKSTGDMMLEGNYEDEWCPRVDSKFAEALRAVNRD